MIFGLVALFTGFGGALTRDIEVLGAKLGKGGIVLLAIGGAVWSAP